MKPQLTPQQKADEKLRRNLKYLHNTILSAHNFHKITTWEDVSKYTPVDKHGTVTFPELKEFLGKQTQELEERIAGHERTKSVGVVSSTTTPESLHATTRDSTNDKESRVPRSTEHDELYTTQDFLQETQPYTTGDEEHTLLQPDVSPPSTDTPSNTIALQHTEVDSDSKNDYGWTRSPNVSDAAFAFWFQKKATAQILHKIQVEHKNAVLLIATTGAGKTYIAADVLRHLKDNDFDYLDKENEIKRTWSHIPYLVITRATVVEQTERVFKKVFNIGVDDTEVINIEQLRSKAGRLWVKEKMQIVQGEEQYFWEWKKNINPCVVMLDECQSVKNEGSTQHEIMASFNNLPTQEAYQIFISATPFTRVSEAKCFAVATKKNIEHLGFPKGTILTNETWPAYSAIIAAPSKPFEYNESACERLMKDLDEYVVRVKGIKFQFDADNQTKKIHFRTKEESDYYHGAWNRYCKALARLEAQAIAEGKGSSKGGVNRLVEFLKFRMAAEFCRKEVLAEAMYQSVQSGKAAVCALNFKSTIIAVTKILNEKYGVSRNDISLIWGGGQTALTEKQKTRAKIKSSMHILKKAGVVADGESEVEYTDEGSSGRMSEEEILGMFGLEDVEDRIIEELDPSLRLGAQSQDERQREIDRFQSGKSLYAMFTFRAGGVGLSLHHSDELTTDWDRDVEGFSEWFATNESKPDKITTKEGKEIPNPDKALPGKVRRKESGYAVEEDIKFIPVRARECFLAPTYSAIELVQGLGRCPRLTSLSRTTQILLFYGGTIEDAVYEIVRVKLKCLAKVVRMRERWQDVAEKQTDRDREEYKQKLITSVSEDADGESASMIDIDAEVEEEEVVEV